VYTQAAALVTNVAEAISTYVETHPAQMVALGNAVQFAQQAMSAGCGSGGCVGDGGQTAGPSGGGGQTAGFSGLEPCSFSADTLVATEDGKRPIITLKIGDVVLAYDESLGRTDWYTVTAIWEHNDPIMEYVTIDGERIETTPEHPFFTEEYGWLPASELRLGVHVRNADDHYGMVQAIKLVRRPQPMYNLTVTDAHTFFVGNQQWLVHNTCFHLPGASMSTRAQGAKLADMAKGYYGILQDAGIPTGKVTIAVAESQGKSYVSVYGSKEAVSAIQAALDPATQKLVYGGAQVHAEKALYQWLKGNRVDFGAIGVSNMNGPCSTCQDFFMNDAKFRDVYWEDTYR
jgi:hypothetical protein